MLLSGQHPNPVLLITNLTTAATLQHRCSHAASFSPCERVPAPNLGGAFKLSVLHSILLPPLACDDTSPRVHGGALKTGACSMRACTHTHTESGIAIKPSPPLSLPLPAPPPYTCSRRRHRTASQLPPLHNLRSSARASTRHEKRRECHSPQSTSSVAPAVNHRCVASELLLLLRVLLAWFLLRQRQGPRPRRRRLREAARHASRADAC